MSSVGRAPLAGLLALAMLATACRFRKEPTPEDTLAAWVTAMNASRTDPTTRRAAYLQLSRRAQLSLEERALRASELSGRILQPWEMLAPGRFALRLAFDPERTRASVRGARAVVTVRDRESAHAEVPMVYEHGAWRIDLELPPLPMLVGPSDDGSVTPPAM